MWHAILPILLFLTSVFLILLVLIQRGRGGGLAGAFGGLGGQSAFGTKAGDLFTRITIGVATAWIILCAASVKLLNDSESNLISPTLGNSSNTAPVQAPTTPGGNKSSAAAESKTAPAGGSAPAKAAPADAAPASTAPAKSETPAPEKSK